MCFLHCFYWAFWVIGQMAIYIVLDKVILTVGLSLIVFEYKALQIFYHSLPRESLWQEWIHQLDKLEIRPDLLVLMLKCLSEVSLNLMLCNHENTAAELYMVVATHLRGIRKKLEWIPMWTGVCLKLQLSLIHVIVSLRIGLGWWQTQWFMRFFRCTGTSRLLWWWG